MKRPRGYRPTVQPLEERIALSFSFGSFFHQLIPFIPDNSSNNTPHKKPAQVSAAAQAAAARRAAVHAQRVAALEAHHSQVVAPKSASRYGASVVGDPAPGSVPVYGPYLGRPGSYKHKPPLVTHTVA
jgi:hypothetical protein